MGIEGGWSVGNGNWKQKKGDGEWELKGDEVWRMGIGRWKVHGVWELMGNRVWGWEL